MLWKLRLLPSTQPGLLNSRAWPNVARTPVPSPITISICQNRGDLSNHSRHPKKMEAGHRAVGMVRE